jgi:hypothetical protein
LIPIQPARRQGAGVIPLGTYFSRCPACGGSTGWYLFRSKASAAEADPGQQRHSS